MNSRCFLEGWRQKRVCLGTENDGSGGVPGADHQHAVDLETLMLANLGLGAMEFHDVSTSAELDDLRRSDPLLRRRVERLLEEQLGRAEEIISGRIPEMDAIIGALMTNEVCAGSQVLQLFRSISGDRPAA